MEVIMTEMQSLRQRSAKARRKAIFAGILYLIGTVGMAVAAFLPLTVGVEVGGYGAFGIANFWQPIADAVTNFNDLIATPANYILALTASGATMRHHSTVFSGVGGFSGSTSVSVTVSCTASFSEK
jgi:hypothetical protein